jgi:hypothetical protein
MERLMLDIQHGCNPLHVYCRLRDMGFRKRGSLLFSRFYELLFYKWLIPLTNIGIFLFRLKKRRIIHRPLTRLR